MIWDTNMAAVLLSYDTNMVAVTSYENILKSPDANFAVAKRKPEKKLRSVRDSNPWPLQYWCNALTNWANKPTGSRSLNWFVMSPWKDDDENYEYISEKHLCELRGEELYERWLSQLIDATFAELKAWIKKVK